LTGNAKGVYLTMNPLSRDLLARRCNRVDWVETGLLAADKDVLRRRWLLIDADPVRDPQISANNVEKSKAEETIQAVRQHLRSFGWPEPILGDSGNGYHALYRVDLAADDNGLVKRVLTALAKKFDSDAAKVDTKVFNPARIVKLPGTMARKGDGTPERPHRRAKLLEIPGAPNSFSVREAHLEPVPLELLEALAAILEDSNERAVGTNHCQVHPAASRANLERSSVIARARAYIGTMPPAISGQNGHHQTFKVACKLVVGFGLSVNEAMPLMQEYSERCEPPWSEAEIRHKLDDAEKEPGPRGTLLAANEHHHSDGRNGLAPDSGIQLSGEWTEIVPFGDYDLPPFPVATLPLWLRRFVEGVPVATQTPVDMAALLVLAACAVALAKKIRVQVNDEWSEPLNIYAVVVLPPGNRKSAVFSLVVAPLENWEEEEVARLTPEIAESQECYQISQAKLKKLRQAAISPKLSSEKRELAAEEAKELAKELAAMEIKSRPRLIADDASSEKLTSLLAQQGGRMAVLSPEGDVFEIMAGRYSDKGEGNFAVYLKGHSGDTLRVDRISRAPEYVRGPALTLGLTVQPDVIKSLCSKPGFRGRGLLGRFFYSLPRSMLGHRDVEPPSVPVPVMEDYDENLRRLLVTQFRIDPEGKPNANLLRLSNEAHNLLIQFMKELEPELGPGGTLDHISDWAGKLAGGIVRIAGLLHVSEHVTASNPWDLPISVDTLQRAIKIGQYFTPHAQAAFEEMAADPIIDSAKHILAWITAQRPMSFSKRDAYQALKGRFKRAEDLDAPFETLRERGYIRKQSAQTRPGPGRPPGPVYEVNPALNTLTAPSGDGKCRPQRIVEDFGDFGNGMRPDHSSSEGSSSVDPSPWEEGEIE
jgi:hypothetical protein